MREKRARSQEKHEPLFDFPSDGFDAKTQFQVNFEGISDDVISRLAQDSKERAKQAQKHLKHMDSANLAGTPSLPVSKQDPMNPQIYEGHHRRMEREERRMQVQERQQLTVMASRIRSQIDMLVRGDWRSNIEKIVRIEDISDAKETIRKRDLALNEMRKFLAKFEEYNRRCNRREEKPVPSHRQNVKVSKSRKATIKNKLKRTVNDNEGQSDSDTEDLQLSIRPFAFGYMVPPRKFPFGEFQLSKLLLTEVESHDLVENLKKRRAEIE